MEVKPAIHVGRASSGWEDPKAADPIASHIPKVIRAGVGLAMLYIHLPVTQLITK